jgi:xylan 1,4-beta-xylosidase
MTGMMFHRRDVLRGSAGLAALAAVPVLGEQPGDRLAVSVDTHQTTGALHHVWEECAGSDRAAISLRETWRQDLDRWRGEVGLKRVRFHGILNDELGVDTPTWLNAGHASPNFRDVFEVYDGLLAHGVSPYVELSFMPKALASGTRTFGFYNGNVTPPASLEAWGDFITIFVRALADRYGIAVVRQWPFEVWNEPNLSVFWAGTQAQYFEFYKATAVAIKGVDAAIQVGGPSTASVGWIGEFLAYCADNNAPVDFVATHCYAGDPQAKIFGPGPKRAQNQVIPDAIALVRQKIEASRFAGRPLWLSEWSSDSPAMIANVISQCLPHLQAMSHWALSGTYEEIGVPDFLLKEGDNGFPAMFRGIARPNFNTYKLLHLLGRQRLNGDGPVLASRRADGKTAALVWNLADVPQAMGLPAATSTRTVIGTQKQLDVRFDGARPGTPVRVRFVDQQRGSPMPAWRAMGSPKLPTELQIATLRRAADIAPAMAMRLDAHSTLSLALPPEGVALIEFV